MFKHIMIPIDLAEREKWLGAVNVASDLAGHYGAKLLLVSVAGGLQAKVSHSIEKYRTMLAEFAAEIAGNTGLDVGSEVYSVPDPSVEVDAKLLEAIDTFGIDLVVTASHKPGWAEYIVNSHSGRLARHAHISVFVVREG